MWPRSAPRARAGGARPPTNSTTITTAARDMPELELALLRRSVDALARKSEHCARCGRSPLIGERVYLLAGGATVCELCRSIERSKPIDSQVVRGPAFGRTMRILDHRETRPRAA